MAEIPAAFRKEVDKWLEGLKLGEPSGVGTGGLASFSIAVIVRTDDKIEPQIVTSPNYVMFPKQIPLVTKHFGAALRDRLEKANPPKPRKKDKATDRAEPPGS